MSATERAISIGVESQFDLLNEVASLTRNRSPETTLTQILHLFAEFACQAPLVNYQYIQTADMETGEPLLTSPGFEKEGDVLNMYIRKPRLNPTRRAWQEYYGFANMREKIINAKDPSFVVLVSPPGPRKEGYGKYGFFYLGCVPQYQEGKNREIQMYSFRINNFDDDLVVKSRELLRAIDPESQIPADAKTDELLVRPIIVPFGQECQIKGEKYVINSPFDLLSLIMAFLNLQVKKEAIEDGLAGRVLKKIHQKFKVEVHRIFNAVWSAAKGIPVRLDGRELFQVFEDIPYEGGSCPSAGSDPLERLKSTDPDKEDEIHWCPMCGQFFKGNKCLCGYTIGEG